VPDVAVLDIRLRIGNGMDVLRHIRARALKTRVIVFSQYDDPDYREQFRAAGADFFFAKTNETAHLQQTLKQMVTPG
jgi:DNA-binding NarL/FixJ family response regulator